MSPVSIHTKLKWCPLDFYLHSQKRIWRTKEYTFGSFRKVWAQCLVKICHARHFNQSMKRKNKKIYLFSLPTWSKFARSAFCQHLVFNGPITTYIRKKQQNCEVLKKHRWKTANLSRPAFAKSLLSWWLKFDVLQLLFKQQLWDLKSKHSNESK